MRKGFSLVEKILMGVGIYGSVIVGAHGISLESIPWALVYLGFVLLGMLFLFGYGICSHCPYIFEEYSDCLFPPWGRIYRKIFKYRPEPLTMLDKIAFLTIMIGIPLFPQFWLFENHGALILFWIFYLPTACGFIFYECRRCQHFGCPFNMAEKS
ncbi:MAG: hypothetical protein JXD19_05365 [Deltaproteobacteria bacterium]|nr:hypothetical protein [Deltaproteobacteria bacterium]